MLPKLEYPPRYRYISSYDTESPVYTIRLIEIILRIPKNYNRSVKRECGPVITRPLTFLVLPQLYLASTTLTVTSVRVCCLHESLGHVRFRTNVRAETERDVLESYKFPEFLNFLLPCEYRSTTYNTLS